MQPRNADEAVLNLSRSGVVMFDGASAGDCWEQAFQAAGAVGPLDDLIDAAKRRGLMANQIRGARGNEPSLYRLYVPATGRGGYSGRI